MKMTHADLTAIMAPKSVAVIGASDTPGKVGHAILKNYIDGGYRGGIYPINIKASGTIMGLKAYRRISDVKMAVDLAVIAVPAESVPGVLEECGRAKVRGSVVVSGGFAEVGRQDLENAVIRISKRHSMPVIGPNCLGVMDPRTGVNTLFLPSFKIDKPTIGGISFASQSGAVGSTVLDLLNHEGFGLSKFISYGNAAVVDEVDVLNYLANDEQTKVIIFYMEGVKRGREFIDVAKKATAGKPVIISKGGMTMAGAQAAHSHTAALAGDSETYAAVFRQFGFTQAEDLRDLMNFAKIFNTQPLTAGDRVAVITNGGGAGVLETDAIYQDGLRLAELSNASKRELRKAMPPIVNIRLPLDLAGDADDRRFGDAFRIIQADPNVDAIIAIALFQTPGADSKVASTLIDYGTSSKKPFVVVSIGGNYTQQHSEMIESGGVPVYGSPGDAARSLAALVRYSRYRGSL